MARERAFLLGAQAGKACARQSVYAIIRNLTLVGDRGAAPR